MINKKIKGLLELLGAAILLLLSSYIVQTNLGTLEKFISKGILGMTVYVFVEIVSIVIAPVTTLPILFIASNLWGWFVAGILNFIGWTIGSILAFLVARKYGVTIIKKFIPIKKVYEIQNKIPRKHFFWSVVLLRIIVPADILSYALGLFTKMSTRNYVLSTIIGIIPAAFIYSYLGAIPTEFLVIVLLIVGILIVAGWITRILCKKCVAFVKEKWGYENIDDNVGETSFSEAHIIN